MISSYAWDTAVRFAVGDEGEAEYESGGQDKKEVAEEKSGMDGKKNAFAMTGESGDKNKNIYDLGGNVYEGNTE